MARLAERFPAVFTPGQARPLKLRIQADIQQRAPGEFSRRVLGVVLQRHTTSTAYLKALAKGGPRIDLDGQPAGELAEEHRLAAEAELARRRALHDARRAAAARVGSHRADAGQFLRAQAAQPGRLRGPDRAGAQRAGRARCCSVPRGPAGGGRGGEPACSVPCPPSARWPRPRCWPPAPRSPPTRRPRPARACSSAPTA
ncbi:ProQ/FinO family protein [Piscinibacter sakaiensis]|uniref:ProQ/FINO family protein n=1 Tax=Piscinibacter sakaiensis TaxID=1547922 RepID=UPI00372A1E0A